MMRQCTVACEPCCPLCAGINAEELPPALASPPAAANTAPGKASPHATAAETAAGLGVGTHKSSCYPCLLLCSSH